MYIKNIKVANFWLCFWETLFDVYLIFQYFIMNAKAADFLQIGCFFGVFVTKR